MAKVISGSKKSTLRRKIQRLDKSIDVYKLTLELKNEKVLNKEIKRLYKDFDKLSTEMGGNELDIKAKIEKAIANVDKKQYWKRRALTHTFNQNNLAVESGDQKVIETKDTWTKEYTEAISKFDLSKEQCIEKINTKYLSQIIKGTLSDEESIIEIDKLAQANQLKIEAFKCSLEKDLTDKVSKLRVETDLKIEIEQEKLKVLSKNSKELDSDVILSLEGLSMHFGGLKAVDNLSFNVKKGEIFGLIGPNGAGKTTVFNCITQFYNPTAGNVYYRNPNDEIMLLNDEKVHDVINYGIVRTFQNVELVWELSILENLLVAGHSNYQSNLFTQMFNLKMLKREEQLQKQKAIQVLEYLDLTEYQYRSPYGLPYGILKRIELARTLMCNPSLIILDEPAAGLNDQETIELSKIIKRIQQELNVTIFLVEHDMGLVMDICDHICAISFGKLLAIGTPDEIQQNRSVQEAYLGVEGDE